LRKEHAVLRTLRLVVLLIAFPASAEVTFEWATIGDPGNACDPPVPPFYNCIGSVSETYRISKYEVTNAQYVEFLNAVAASDPNQLYDPDMEVVLPGITRSGSSGSYSYSVIPGREDKPVNHVSFWDAARFANWLHNGQPTGAQGYSTTERGAYYLTPEDVANNTVAREPDAAFFIPNVEEWYKAAYYDTDAKVYFDYPAGSDTQTTCAMPGPAANTANCGEVLNDFTDVGSYTGAASPNGTFDQGGNVWEWNESVFIAEERGLIGGNSFLDAPFFDAAQNEVGFVADGSGSALGFRVGSVASASPVPLLPPSGVGALWIALGTVGYLMLQRK